MFASSLNLNQRKWLDTPVGERNSIKRAKSTVKPKWPFFGKMAEVEHDLHWKDYWERASKGKFPIGFSFNGVELFYSYRNKISKVIITNNVPDMCQLIKHMFQENSSIFSPLDLKHIYQKKELLYNNTENEIIAWSKCSNSQKNTLVTYFLLELVSQYSLNVREKDELYQTLNIGINIGAFNDKTIQIDNSSIVNIIGLERENGKFFINQVKAPFKIKKPSKNMVINNNDYCLYSYWLKLNTPKTNNRDKVTEVIMDNIDTSLSSSYFLEEE